MQTQTKNSNGDSSRKTKIYALLRNVLRPVVAGSPAGVGARLLVGSSGGLLDGCRGDLVTHSRLLSRRIRRGGRVGSIARSRTGFSWLNDRRPGRCVGRDAVFPFTLTGRWPG